MGTGLLGIFVEQHYFGSIGMGCINSMQCEEGIGLNHIHRTAQ
jgi:hypothetical protein